MGVRMIDMPWLFQLQQVPTAGLRSVFVEQSSEYLIADRVRNSVYITLFHLLCKRLCITVQAFTRQGLFDSKYSKSNDITIHAQNWLLTTQDTILDHIRPKNHTTLSRISSLRVLICCCNQQTLEHPPCCRPRPLGIVVFRLVTARLVSWFHWLCRRFVYSLTASAN